MDQWGDCNTPEVWRPDKVAIKPPIKEIEETDNKCFHMEIIGNWVPYSDDIENSWRNVLDNELQPNETQLDTEVEDDFYNPNENHSIEPGRFLSFLNLEDECSIATPNYSPKKKSFHYLVEAMLRLIAFKRLAKIRYDTVLSERLHRNIANCASDLGFACDGNGGFLTPSQPSVNRFVYNYMGLEGHQSLLDRLLRRLKKEMDQRGITFGERVGIDSCPLETLSQDEIGVYNAHYFQEYNVGKMMKVHFLVCMDTGIPIVGVCSDGNAYDGDFLLPLLLKAKKLGFDFKEVYGDVHYGTLENWAKVNRFYGAKCYFNLAENAVFRDDGKPENLQKEYQKLHHNDDFKPQDQISFEEMLDYLILHGEHDCVGAYYRNEWWKIKEKNIDLYKKIKSARNNNENLHSILKEQLDFNNHLSRKGWTNIEIYVKQFLITMVIVALIRVQNGIMDGFVKISEGVFS